ncbi:MAG: glutathione S-transferase [Caulobacterales bacterium 32-69-10]|nr:MAG: glutathione S-transferase [Caulobacterales bacterium 32-69-10]
MTIYGDLRSGNCLKVKWTADHLGRAYDWVHVDIMSGGSRTPAFLAMNPAGQVPAVVLEDGRALAQSNAIIFHLAEGSDLIPQDAYDRAKMFEWLFWEQYSHEPVIAVRRFQKLYLGKAEDEIEPRLMERGLAVLGLMERALAAAPWLAGDRLSLADISLSAYTGLAHEGGFEMSGFPAIQAWLGRVQTALGAGG